MKKRTDHARRRFRIGLNADRYKVERDGTLHLTSGEGDLDESLRLTHLRREALENGKTYFVSKKTLILRKVKYERAK